MEITGFDIYRYHRASTALSAIDLQVPLKFNDLCCNGETQINAELAEEVCKSGNMEMLWFLYKCGCPFDSRAYKSAKYHCHRRCVEFLEQIGCNENTPIKDESFTIHNPKPSYTKNSQVKKEDNVVISLPSSKQVHFENKKSLKIGESSNSFVSHGNYDESNLLYDDILDDWCESDKNNLDNVILNNVILDGKQSDINTDCIEPYDDIWEDKSKFSDLEDEEFHYFDIFSTVA
jgi:hypothetical protein